MNEYVEHFPFFVVVHALALCFETLSCDAIPLNWLVFFRRSIDGYDYEGAESVASERKERIFFCHFHGEQTVTRWRRIENVCIIMIPWPFRAIFAFRYSLAATAGPGPGSINRETPLFAVIHTIRRSTIESNEIMNISSLSRSLSTGVHCVIVVCDSRLTTRVGWQSTFR